MWKEFWNVSASPIGLFSVVPVGTLKPALKARYLFLWQGWLSHRTDSAPASQRRDEKC